MPAQFFTMLLSGLLMIGMPVALGFYLSRRFRLGWRLWWIGAATFILSQVGHIPFNWIMTLLFQNHVLPTPPAAWSLPFNAVFLGLSAGLWEELARAAVYRWWADDARSWRKGVQLGAGHGGIEAIILGVLLLFQIMVMVAMRGEGLARMVPPAQMALAKQQVDAFWSTPLPLTLIGAVERAFTLIFHIACSLLVLQAFTRRQPFWIALAIFWHTLVDGSLVYLSGIWRGNDWSPYAVEGFMALSALISLAIIFALRQPEPEPEVVEAPVPVPAPPVNPEELELKVTDDSLERSKYL